VQAKTKSKTWLQLGARNISCLLTNRKPLYSLGSIEAMLGISSERRAFTVYAPANEVRRFEASFSALSGYDAFYLEQNVSGGDYAQYIPANTIDRPSGFTLELAWEHTLNAQDFGSSILNGIWDRLCDVTLGSLNFNSMGLVHSTGTAWRDIDIVGEQRIGDRFVVYYKSTYPVDVSYSNIGTIQVKESVTNDFISATISPFNKPSEAELIVELRVTIDVYVDPAWTPPGCG